MHEVRDADDPCAAPASLPGTARNTATLAKNDRLDSAILARLPLLHPEGLREYTGDGPADPLRRIVKQRSSIARRRAAIFHRLDAKLELLGPAWYDALVTDYGHATCASWPAMPTRTP